MSALGAKSARSNDRDNANKSITRRRFLKTTGVAAGIAVAAATPTLAALATDYEKGHPNTEGEQIFNCVCPPNCYSFCPIQVHVREGHIVKTSRATISDHPEYNRICQRGLTHPARMYAPSRVKYPMKRAEGTERGAEQWERISWDEAIDLIANTFRDLQNTYGPQAVMFNPGSGNNSVLKANSGMFMRLYHVMNASLVNHSVDRALTIGVNRVTGGINQGWVTNEPADFVNAKTIVAWGNNITDAQPQEWHFVNEAMQSGTKLVVVDPAFTQLAAKADLWVPIRPGSDTVMFMAIMNIAFEEDAHDVEFLASHTVAPFLVRSDTGKFLRSADGADDSADGNKPLVWDNATESLVAADEAKDPALSLTCDFNGVECRTALDLLKEEIAPYTPSVVSEMTGVAEETIYELAHICEDGPVIHRAGWGAQAYDNGVHASHAGVTMCAVLGNIGKPGATFGGNYQFDQGVNTSAMITKYGKSDFPVISQLYLREIMRTGTYKGKDFPIKAMWNMSANPMNTYVDTNEWLHDVIDRLDFVVTSDFTYTETAKYSDLVLPACYWFEMEDVTAAGAHHLIIHSEKAVEPLYESKPDTDIIRMVADKLGLGEFFPATDQEYLEEALKSEKHDAMGITYETLKERHQMRYLKYPFIAFENNTFATDSGRMEFYVESTPTNCDMGQELPVEREHLPRWIEPKEAWIENEKHKSYPFVFMSTRPRYRVHSQYHDIAWLRDLDPEPIVYINPADAQEHGIADEAYAEFYNDRGSSVAKAIYSDGIMPGTLVYPKGWAAWQHKNGHGFSELLLSDWDPVGVNSSFMDCLCNVRPWEGAE